MSRYIRHPDDIPITYSVKARPRQNLLRVGRDFELGGLSFESKNAIEIGTRIQILIAVAEDKFEADCMVTNCHPESGNYRIAVKLDNPEVTYQLRMVEQICYIQHYKIATQQASGRKLSDDQAAIEWIEKYSEDFPC